MARTPKMERGLTQTFSQKASDDPLSFPWRSGNGFVCVICLMAPPRQLVLQSWPLRTVKQRPTINVDHALKREDTGRSCHV